MVKRKKLGRGIENFSHLFLSSKDDDRGPQDVEMEKTKFPTKTIAVVSGVGEPNNVFLILNLAIELNREGLKVVVMTPDGRNPHLNLFQGGISSSLYLSRGELREDTREGAWGIKHVLIDVDLSSIDYLWEEERNLIHQRLRKIERESDIILIHVTKTFLPSIHRILQYISEVIVSTSSYPIGMLEAYSMIKKVFLLNPHAHLGLVVDKTDQDTEGQKIFIKMENVVRKYLHKPIYHLGSILKDAEVEKSIRARKPLVLWQPDSQSVRSVREIAKTICSANIGGVTSGLLHGKERDLAEIFQVVSDDLAAQKN